jgi:hypothetical protein
MTVTWSVSPSVDMLPFGVTILATVPQGSEIPEGLMHNPVYQQYSRIYVNVLQVNPLSHFLPMNFVRISHLSVRAACPTQLFLIYFVAIIIFDAERDMKTLLCVVLLSLLYYLPVTYKYSLQHPVQIGQQYT